MVDGRYEIIHGVLTKRAPAYFAEGEALQKLIYRIIVHIGESIGSFATEVEIDIDDDRVVRADAAFLTRAEESPK